MDEEENKRGAYIEYFRYSYKKKAVRIAKELGYSEETIDKINKAKNDQEISTIMYVAAKRLGE